ncbi:LysR family transcriptional regulator [Streptococcus catagoni]|uniref:LysR family transcriptional regulator n=1 Tax=Streptococcus catagoni TaxID=2654874 RepID=UPI00140A5D93|nr:LysR family transcriptional regulator [Streptococcus catagoni]
MKLDIAQMNYLIAIVDADFNLSVAAKQIYVTQSTLSQFISNFERSENVKLFNRKNGRLISLTPIGKRMYSEVLDIIKKFDHLGNVIEREGQKRRGMIRIGIPSTALRILFTRFFPNFLMQNPDVQIEIVEEDNKRLREMLIDNDLHFAILEAPTYLDDKKFEQHLVLLSEIAAFMRPESPLAKKQILSWSDLDNQFITLLNEGFASNSLIMNKLEKEKSDAKLLMTSSSWDYLVESSAINDVIALLPTARFHRYLDRLNYIGVVEKRFDDPIPYKPIFCRPLKKKYSTIENYVFETILKGFYKFTNNNEK